VLAICLYTEPYESSARLPSSFLKVRFNIALPSTTRSSKWSLSPRSLHMHVTFMLRATCPAGLCITVHKLLPVPSFRLQIDTKLTWDNLNLCFCYNLSYLRGKDPSQVLSPVKSLHMQSQRASQPLVWGSKGKVVRPHGM